MGAVSYNGAALIPAPYVAIRKEIIRAGNGNLRLGGMLNITLKGKILPDKGSPNSAGVFWDQSGYPPDETLVWEQYLDSLLAKVAAVKQLFAADGRPLVIQPWDGAQPTVFNPVVKSVNFPDSTTWFNEVEYEVVLECLDPVDSPDSVVEANEEWHIEPTDERLLTFRLTHSLSAVGRIKYDSTGSQISTPWQSAQAYVLGKLGLGADPVQLAASGVLNLSGYTAYSNVRQQAVNEITGSFSATESFIGYNPSGQFPAWEDFNVSARVSEEGRLTATVGGTVTGLEQRDSNWNIVTTRYSNAANQFGTYVQPNLLGRCQAMLNTALNAVPLNQQVGRNPVTGVITYSTEYSDRPSSLFPGSVSESFTQNDRNPTDVFASLQVLNRALGPVLQSIGTVTARKRSLNIEVVMPCATQTRGSFAPDTDGFVLSAAPVGSVVFLEDDSSSFDPITGRYSRQTAWTWEA